MKKIPAIIIAAAVLAAVAAAVYIFSVKSPEAPKAPDVPAESAQPGDAASPSPTPSPVPKSVEAEKFSDTLYSGTVTAIGENDISVIMGDTENITYILSEKAKQDIKILGITAGMRVMVSFEKAADGTLTAQGINKLIAE